MVPSRLTPTDRVEIRATPLGPWKGDAARPQSWQSVCQMGAPTLVGTHPAPALYHGPSRVRIEARRPGQPENLRTTRPVAVELWKAGPQPTTLRLTTASTALHYDDQHLHRANLKEVDKAWA